MGIKQTDLVPISSTGPTVLIPTAKDLVCKVFQLSRTDTTNTLKAFLPADATVLGVKIYASTNSNAGTTATATIQIINNTGTISTGTVNLLTGGATTAEVQMSALPNIEPLPLLGDLQIKAQYAETGTASSAGGPWVFEIRYVR